MKFTNFLSNFRAFFLKQGLKISIISFIVAFGFLSPRSGILVEGSLSTTINNSSERSEPTTKQSSYLSNQTFLTAVNSPEKQGSVREIVVTAYSSTLDQCDSTPFITASGQRVRDGIIASNFLPFGTKVQFPQLFGDKIFQVEDRMHRKYNNSRVDIWFPDRASAEAFGIKKTIMKVID